MIVERFGSLAVADNLRSKYTEGFMRIMSAFRYGSVLGSPVGTVTKRNY